jgi:hypothetical protein
MIGGEILMIGDQIENKKEETAQAAKTIFSFKGFDTLRNFISKEIKYLRNHIT